MLQTNGSHITMHSGDYGIPLPFRVFGGEFLPTDKFRFAVNRDGNEVLHKDIPYTDVSGNAFMLMFTEEDAALLTAGSYTWCMALVRDNEYNTFKGPCTMEVISCAD